MDDTKFRRVKTVLLFLIWVAMGMYVEIFGPTMADLAVLYKTDVGTVGRTVAAIGAGLMAVSMATSCLLNKWEGWLHLITAVLNCVSAVTVILVPYTSNTGMLWGLCFTIGVTIGALNIVGLRLLKLMWKEHTYSPAVALYVGFGVGASLISLLANPFLESPPDGSSNSSVGPNITTTFSRPQTESSSSLYQVTTENPTEDFDRESSIKDIFLVVGLLTMSLSVPFCLFQCTNMADEITRYETLDGFHSASTRLFASMDIQSSNTGGTCRYNFGLVFLSALFFINGAGSEQMFGTFVRAMSLDHLQIRPEDASRLTTVFWVFLTIGRLLGAILARKFPINRLILIGVALNMVAMTTLSISFTTATVPLVWLFTAVHGLLIGPLLPVGVVFASSYMGVNDICLAVIVISIGLGDFLFVWLVGSFGTDSVPYFMLAGGLALVASVVGFHILVRGHSDSSDEDVISRETLSTSRFPTAEMDWEEEEETPYFLVSSEEDF